ncbi:MAG: hypothetical protein ACFFB5_02750 [Promethearchaeota archaeon]
MFFQLTLDQKTGPLFRFLLFIGFFITCVIIPAAKIIPFFERSEWHWGGGDYSYTLKFSYFFDSYYIHESGYIRYYFENFHIKDQIDYLAIPGWSMVLLGILVLILAIVEFLKKENFSILWWLSMLTIISIVMEWLLMIVIMIQEPWIVGTFFASTWYPPVLNIYLLVIMFIGIICLISANWLNKFYKPIES